MKTNILIISTAMFFSTGGNNISPTLPSGKSLSISAPQNADFAFFRVHRQGKLGATATWGLTSTAGVAGFIIQRTYQDPTDPYSYWEDISSVDCDDSRSFKYTDETIFPGLINYRIVAILDDGTSIASETASIKILSH